MFNLIVDLLPLVLVGLLSPVPISVCLAMLSTKQPLGNSIAFFAGVTLILVVAGASILAFLHGRIEGGVGLPELGNGVKLLLGIILISLGVRSWLNEPDSDPAPPKWMARLETMKPWGAFLFGVILIITQLKIVVVFATGLSEIVDARLGLITSIVTFLVFLFLTVLGILMPIVAYSVNPKQGSAMLETIKSMINRTFRVLLIAIMLIAGVWFIFNGLRGIF